MPDLCRTILHYALCIMHYATEEQDKVRAIRVKVDPPVYVNETRHVSRGVLRHVGAFFFAFRCQEGAAM